MKHFLLVLTLISLGAVAGELKSKQVRSMICSNMEQSMDDEGLKTEYESYFGDKIVVIPNYDETCNNSSASFEVIESVYNERAERVVAMNIAIDLKIENAVHLLGLAKVERTAFDPSTGEVKLGKWKITSSKFKIVPDLAIIKKLGEVIAMAADTHNGDANTSTFNPETFSLKKELAKLNKGIKESNTENDSCKMMLAESYDDDSFFDNRDSYTSKNVFNFLKSRNLVMGVIASETDPDDYEESCAFYNVTIYLKDGTVVFIDYDYTT